MTGGLLTIGYSRKENLVQVYEGVEDGTKLVITMPPTEVDRFCEGLQEAKRLLTPIIIPKSPTDVDVSWTPGEPIFPSKHTIGGVESW